MRHTLYVAGRTKAAYRPYHVEGLSALSRRYHTMGLVDIPHPTAPNSQAERRGSIFGVLRYRSVQTPQTPSCDRFETQLSGSMMDLITEGLPIGPHNQSGNIPSRNPIQRRKSTGRASEDYGPGCLLRLLMDAGWSGIRNVSISIVSRFLSIIMAFHD